MKKTKIIRTHDDFYLKDIRKEKTKEYFKFLYKILKRNKKINSKNTNIIDIGCATGELIYYLKNKFKNANFYGLDVHPKLIDYAKKDPDLSDVDFSVGNIINKPRKEHFKKYDIVLFIAVHSIWDDIDTWFSNLKKYAKKDSTIYIFGLFNPNPIDTFVKVRRSESKNKNLEPGWNLISIQTYKRYFKTKKIKKYKFYPWEIKIELPKNNNDLMRSYTQKISKNKYQLTSGIGLIHTVRLLEIKL